MGGRYQKITVTGKVIVKGFEQREDGGGEGGEREEVWQRRIYSVRISDEGRSSEPLRTLKQGTMTSTGTIVRPT